jgi:hypothetical protein
MICLGKDKIGSIVIELIRLEVGGGFGGSDVWRIGGLTHSFIVAE